jgi:hypothetical protein
VGITLHFACAGLRNKVSSTESCISGLLESWDLFDYLWAGFISADFSLAAGPFVTVVFLLKNIVTSGV